jgi:hypothetical protein
MMEHISNILPSLMLDVVDTNNDEHWEELMKQYTPGLHLLNGNVKDVALNLIVKFAQGGNRTLVFDQAHGYNQVLNKQILSAYSGWSNRALQNNQINFGVENVKKVLDTYGSLPIFIDSDSDEPLIEIFEQYMAALHMDVIFILNAGALELELERYQEVAKFLDIPIIVLDEGSYYRELRNLYEPYSLLEYGYKSVTFFEVSNHLNNIRVFLGRKQTKIFVAQKVFDESLKYRLK